ncbi:MAG: BlaI/MecI/CopY family transcriptional regulator [Thermoanaerobaculia bacterium]|nr:BlaI/MecI/CopY family transcriptional regulator [Thermoanaerobaculia bacterium]
MPRKPSRTLTDGEARIMEVIWDLGRATVRDVSDRLAAEEEVAYNTVQTMMAILERKGALRRRREGRAHVYEPLLTRSQARSQALQHVLGRFFASSPHVLLQSLLAEEQVDAAQIEKMRRLLDEAPEEGDDT